MYDTCAFRFELDCCAVSPGASSSFGTGQLETENEVKKRTTCVSAQKKQQCKRRKKQRIVVFPRMLYDFRRIFTKKNMKRLPTELLVWWQMTHHWQSNAECVVFEKLHQYHLGIRFQIALKITDYSLYFVLCVCRWRSRRSWKASSYISISFFYLKNNCEHYLFSKTHRDT